MKGGKGTLRDILIFFRSGPVVGGLLGLTTLGLLLSLTRPDLLPPTLFFAGVWYTRLLWMLLGLSLGALALHGLLRAVRTIRDRGLPNALYRFLTSVRLAVLLIALLALLGLISTLVPQLALNRRVDLIARYGAQNFELLERLGFFTIFSTWYAYALVGLFVLNLGACTVKRLRASVRYVRAPMGPKRPDALARMPHHAALTFAPARAAEVREHVRRVLRRRGFRVREADGQLLAEKWRWERFSIDVFHISLLLAIGALLVTHTFGYDYLEIAYEGDVLPVPGRPFQVRVEEFWSENYPGTERVMDWKTRLTVIDEQGRALKTGVTEVNHPFSYAGVSFYQAAMGEDWLGGARVTLRIVRAADGADLGTYSARVGESFTLPEEGLRVRVGAFLPDFALLETPQGKQAYSKSLKLLNPAAHLEVYDADTGELRFQTWAFARLPELQFVVENPYRFFLEGMVAPQFTGLEISWDPGLPVAYGAFALMTLMLVAHLLLRHQMLWVSLDPAQGRLMLGGRSRKGDFPAFESIVDELTAHPAIAVPSAAEDGQAQRRPVAILEEGS